MLHRDGVGDFNIFFHNQYVTNYKVDHCKSLSQVLIELIKK